MHRGKDRGEPSLEAGAQGIERRRCPLTEAEAEGSCARSTIHDFERRNRRNPARVARDQIPQGLPEFGRAGYILDAERLRAVESPPVKPFREPRRVREQVHPSR